MIYGVLKCPLCRPVATGGRGGLSPPWKNLSPSRGPVPFALTIGIEVYSPPPWNSVSPPC